MIEPILGWSAAGLSVLGLYLMAKKRWECYVPWLVGSPLWIVLGVMTKSYETVVTFGAYQIMNIYGLYNWRFRKDEK